MIFWFGFWGLIVTGLGPKGVEGDGLWDINLEFIFVPLSWLSGYQISSFPQQHIPPYAGDLSASLSNRTEGPKPNYTFHALH